jgi:hypothetical protein
MAASTTYQTQGGNDVSTTRETPTVVVSSRATPVQVTRSEGSASTTTQVQRGSTSQQKSRQRIGCTISFSIKVLGNMPPITT